ncbi:MAG: hypothetical protein LQ343_004305 [Gyalolechia ehrenbergii]|nr:MAG: hypothetical protein LQ343_004305 [Gyalolechia ehrenbergii]
MHKPPLAPLIHAWLFPHPKSTDPPNFQAYISKQLVPEVRAETARFYGHVDCVEAQYPGLDYAVAAHRLRLSRFPHHRCLFQVFDQLRLTNHEIQTLCKWEGTRWARERYEKDIGSRVRETTWDDVVLAVPEPPTVTRAELQRETNPSLSTRFVRSQGTESSNDQDAMGILAQNIPAGPLHSDNEDLEDEEVDGESRDEEEAGDAEQEAEESEDELQQSVGVELNQRLVAATDARNRGEEAVLDADWEQWLREAAERGAIPDVTLANAGQGYPRPSANWAPQLPAAFQTASTRLELSTSFSIPATANSALDGTSAPPAGTAM